VTDQADWVAAEIDRRRAIWQEVLDRGGPVEMSPDEIRDLGLYRGMAGIFRDKANRSTSDAPEGVAITLLHTGQSYADDLSEDGLLYHYPSTGRPGSTDEGDIESGRVAHRLGIPVFVSAAKSKSAKSRDLHLGYIEEVDDDLRMFLVTFVQDVRRRSRVSAPSTASNDAFELLDGEAEAVLGMVRKRPNQQRFALAVMQRYGRACAVCDFAVAECIQAAHIVPKSVKGSDDPRNGLPLCANHHLTYDADLWAIDPSAAEVVARPDGPSAEGLGILRADLLHLPELPHDDALANAWTRWRRKFRA
jgi:putative restriction endonuclease